MNLFGVQVGLQYISMEHNARLRVVAMQEFPAHPDRDTVTLYVSPYEPFRVGVTSESYYEQTIPLRRFEQLLPGLVGAIG